MCLCLSKKSVFITHLPFSCMDNEINVKWQDFFSKHNLVHEPYFKGQLHTAKMCCSLFFFQRCKKMRKQWLFCAGVSKCIYFRGKIVFWFGLESKNFA